MSILITGARGFVARNLASALLAQSRSVRLSTRGAIPADLRAPIVAMTGAGDQSAHWQASVQGCETVVHLAARAHVMRDRSADPLAAFRLANVALSRACAQAAARAGVKRFVFASSIGVLGNETGSAALKATDAPTPHSAYSQSKLEAEESLKVVASDTGIELVIVRPTLIYGPRAPGNFGTLMRVIQRGIPLPLASVTHNRRSFVALDNLVDLLITCIDHPAAANQTFLVSDGEDLSTADLLRRLGQAMNKPARLFPVSPALLQLGATALGKRDMAQRLLGNLQVDISHTRETLNWTPPVSVDEGLRRAVEGLVQ